MRVSDLIQRIRRLLRFLIKHDTRELYAMAACTCPQYQYAGGFTPANVLITSVNSLRGWVTSPFSGSPL